MASIRDILKGSDYALTLFSPAELAGLEIIDRSGKFCLQCLIRNKLIVAKPEEVVRQLYLSRLISHYGYPKDRISVEKPVHFGSSVHEKAADIVIWDRNSPVTAFIVVECKKPNRRGGIEQLKSYCNAEGTPIGVWTNGGATAYFRRDGVNLYRELPDIPRADQTLADVLAKPWTLADLERENVLATERTTLRDIILDMEDLVLANAGVDAFEEVFKLIYAKLYDEHQGARDRSRGLQFHVGGHTASEFAATIDRLFKKARVEWPGVFDDADRVNLNPDHLRVCGSVLERVKLFNSNLQVIDDAFEYLSVQAAKGSKGQFFTPRHVIDMAVKMMNPKVDEYVIDTAAGSCGFTVHSIFHVWGGPVDEPTKWQADYAGTHAYAIDFDHRATKIAHAVNLIAGDGRTNVYRANTLDPHGWSEDVRAGMKPRLRRFKDVVDTKQNQQNMQFFDFDLLLTNPPFGGDIRESQILTQYDLAKRVGNAWKDRMPRDILFIERNLDFLKPGGRAAIVLPQARLNAPAVENVRRFLLERARVVAVVSLHVNTFKPHTQSTKTSVLFLQTWDEDSVSPTYNPKTDSYPVFFAVSKKPGKDGGGRYMWQIGDDNAPRRDRHGNMMVDHDLDEIATAFVEWGKASGLTFLREGA